jgi:hypothetical protein
MVMRYGYPTHPRLKPLLSISPQLWLPRGSPYEHLPPLRRIGRHRFDSFRLLRGRTAQHHDSCSDTQRI